MYLTDIDGAKTKEKESLGAVSDEQVERLHQDIRTMEIRYQGRWYPVAVFGERRYGSPH
ncbi:unnamed protein product [Callosobruchus maculatus]|uniref:Uncharacterized protein n=1 Tax=Callosobruchus maculatus TaxID=64391 RepID=A0A653CLB9_CALMS|nr:unnamed protein product [Callosobruchus maculatus]